MDYLKVFISFVQGLCQAF